LNLSGCGIFSNLKKEGQEVETLVAVPKANPCRYSRQGVEHVGEERRAVLRPVAPQGPCILIEADGAKTLKII
jgi:hypothetical protein